MKYTMRFPETKQNDEPIPGLVYFRPLMDCFICREQTHFANVLFGAGICSEECARRLEELDSARGRAA